MASSASYGSALVTSIILDEVSKPPPGIVLPPKDIRAIVEKTAGYVARNGSVFEERIRDKEKNNPKFSFLSTNDAYSPFYAWRLNEIREGRGTAISAGRVGETIHQTEPAKPKGPTPPQDFHFSARMPNINAQDLDVVKLTALFVAKNGRSFMTILSQREGRNYQFDFLRPQHSLYQFFSRLVDQYTELLQAATADGRKPQKSRSEDLNRSLADRYHVLARAKQRAEWVKFQEQQKVQKEEDEIKEQLEYAQIDWHDFVVVETVLFTEADDQADLPGPTSLNDLQSASLEQKAAMSLQPQSMRIEEAMPTDDASYYDNFPRTQHYGMLSTATSVNPHNVYLAHEDQHTQGEIYPAAQDDDEGRAIAERSEARERTQAMLATAKGQTGQPMRIRNDYVPRAQAKRQSMATGLCPNCMQQIPLDEMQEHMRSKLPNLPNLHNDQVYSSIYSPLFPSFCIDFQFHFADLFIS